MVGVTDDFPIFDVQLVLFFSTRHTYISEIHFDKCSFNDIFQNYYPVFIIKYCVSSVLLMVRWGKCQWNNKNISVKFAFLEFPLNIWLGPRKITLMGLFEVLMCCEYMEHSLP